MISPFQGNICNKGSGVLPVVLLSTETFDAATVDRTAVILGGASEAHVDKKSTVGDDWSHGEATAFWYYVDGSVLVVDFPFTG